MCSLAMHIFCSNKTSYMNAFLGIVLGYYFFMIEASKVKTRLVVLIILFTFDCFKKNHTSILIRNEH